jgi:hypothetical protein
MQRFEHNATPSWPRLGGSVDIKTASQEHTDEFPF